MGRFHLGFGVASALGKVHPKMQVPEESVSQRDRV